MTDPTTPAHIPDASTPTTTAPNPPATAARAPRAPRARATRGARLDADKTQLADIIGEIEWAKSSLVAPEDYPGRIVPDRRDCPVPPEQFVQIFKNYEQLKRGGEQMLLQVTNGKYGSEALNLDQIRAVWRNRQARS